MANGFYDKGRESFVTQNPALDWDTDTIQLDLIDAADYTRDLANHQYRSSVPGAARVATSSAFAGKTGTNGVLDANDVVLSGVSGDPSEELIIFKNSGADATSSLIINVDSATGLPVTPNGGDITVAWDNGANKIAKI